MNGILFFNELRRGFRQTLIWTSAIVFFILACILIFPSFAPQMSGVQDLFGSMGTFSEAFGMDKLNFGTFIGYYAVECGNILGLGGAMFAAIIDISSLAGEEGGHTAEFLFIHPLTRVGILGSKLAASLLLVVIMNTAVFVLSVLGTLAIGQSVPFSEMSLLHLSFLCCQLEIAALCFGISAFLRSSSAGLGIGLSLGFYFMNIVANISDKLSVLKYITPFGYCEASEIIASSSLDGQKILIGFILALAGIASAYIHYPSKDLRV